MRNPVVLLILFVAITPVLISSQGTFSPYVDQQGGISRPQDYREK